MMPRTGQRNVVIGLQRIVRAVDANGIHSESWFTYATCWAQILNYSDAETERQGTVGAIGRNDIRLPYYPGVSNLDRVSYGTKFFNIQGVNDVDEMHRELILTVLEQT
jgi:SPP1 family predicted phage head-tail adaptor